MKKLRRVLDKEFVINNSIPEPNSGCWIWLRYLNRCGYGTIRVGETMEPAHRVSWEIFNNAKVLRGFCGLHKCDNPPCVNPEHVFIGTRAENVLDMLKKGRHKPNYKPHGKRKFPPNRENFIQKIFCKHGHSFNDVSNVTVIVKTNGRIKRVCRTCARRNRGEYIFRKTGKSYSPRKRKLTNEDVKTIRFFYVKKFGYNSTTRIIGKIFNIPAAYVYDVCNKKYKNVT